jgi:phosphate transport system substrate-binding protein
VETIEGRGLVPGTLVAGAYRIVRPLAEGGMGVVYEVEQVATTARRALKVMHGRFAADATLRARFVREARLAASISSDHVAQVLDAGQDEASGALFIVMELLDGVTLGREIRQSGAFGWTSALMILGQIAHALGAAHARGIVHRDLKPGNVVLTRSRHAALPLTVKLLDFGIAKALADVSVEATGVVVGTPAWMAPEQTTAGAPIGPQADVWSFGLLTFMVLTGHHYFPSGNTKLAATAAVLREVVLDPLLPPSDRARELGLAGRLPDGFDGWFARCVDRLPERRYAGALAAYDALALLPAPEPSAPIAAWQDRPARRAMTVDVATAVEVPSQSRSLAPSVPTHAASTLSAPRPPGAPRRRAAGFLGTVAVTMGVVVLSVAWRFRPRDLPTVSLSMPWTFDGAGSVLRIHGSNTIGSELAPALAEAFLQRKTGASAIVRRRTAPDEMVVEARNGERTIDAVEISAHGTATAFADLASARCDIGMASRRIRPEEVAALARWGDMAAAASEHVIALDGIAVIVNSKNVVSALTKRQIGDIFTGEIRIWSDVGGSVVPIAVHARDDRSGTFDTFKQLVVGAAALTERAVRHESSEELSDAVAADEGAIGFIGLPYVRSAKAVMVKDGSSPPLVPSRMTVSTESYPLARRLYLYLPIVASTVAHDFVDFAQSAEGQRIAQATGFVDLRPTCDSTPPECTSCPREYRDTVRGACRVSLDFRFNQDNDRLDARALADVQRVVAMMDHPDLAGRSVLLLGFSDAFAARTDASAVAQERAEAVASQLRARGLRVGVVRGFGATVRSPGDRSPPGGDSDATERVEVWMQ